MITGIRLLFYSHVEKFIMWRFITKDIKHRGSVAGEKQMNAGNVRMPLYPMTDELWTMHASMQLADILNQISNEKIVIIIIRILVWISCYFCISDFVFLNNSMLDIFFFDRICDLYDRRVIIHFVLYVNCKMLNHILLPP